MSADPAEPIATSTLVVPIWNSRGGPSVASLLGIGRSLAYAAVADGTIPSVRVGGRILVPLAALTTMLDGK